MTLPISAATFGSWSAPARRLARWMLIAVLFAALLGCLGCSTVGSRAGATAAAVDEAAAERERRFDRVDRLVQRRYYARDLHGLNWADLRAQYRPRAAAATDDVAWYATVNAMLAELQDAHTRVQRPIPTPARRDGRSAARLTSEADRDRLLQVTDLGRGVVGLKFNRFDTVSARWLAREVERHAEATGLVIDLRDNTGGLITAAQRAVGLFFEDAVPMGVVVTRDGRQSIERSRPGRICAATIPLVVLVGRGSHSSAEVFAYVIQHHRRGLLIGGKTAGEVLGARPHRLTDGGRLFISETDFHRLQGGRLEGAGVEPDIRPYLPGQGGSASGDLAMAAAMQALGF